MKDNETIKEIREIRKKISEQFDHDPKRLVEYYKDKQKQKQKEKEKEKFAQMHNRKS